MKWVASLVASCLDRTAGAARGFSITTYFLLGALTLMQIVNPGAVERIAQQPSGCWLIAAVSLSLFVIALSAAVDVALDRARGLLAPGVCDALLHCSFAVVGLRLSLGAGLVSEGAGDAVIAGLGLIDVGAAAFLVWVADVGADGEDQRRVEEASSYDRRVRGGVMAVLGSLLVAGGVQRTAELGMERSLGIFELPALALTAAAFTAYALHGLWSLREEGRLAFSS